MRKAIIISIVLYVCILTYGCYTQNTGVITKENQRTETDANINKGNIINQIEYGKPVRVTVAIDNNIYEITNVVVTPEELGVSIGLVNRQVSPKPEKNGDIARNTSEGPQIIKDNGGNLYEIKNTKSREEIAIEISKGVYYRCKYIGQLK